VRTPGPVPGERVPETHTPRVARSAAASASASAVSAWRILASQIVSTRPGASPSAAATAASTTTTADRDSLRVSEATFRASQGSQARARVAAQVSGSRWRRSRASATAERVA